MLARNRAALSQLLARSFPASEDIDANTVDAFLDALMAVKTRGSARERASSGEAQARDAAGNAVYRLRATHARRLPVTSIFTGQTEAVRVTLGRERGISWDTPIGVVAPADHLLPTVAAVRERFGGRIARPFAHVEVITPPRLAFARFAPMAIYLGYAHEGDAAPFFYVFEAGTATGQPKMLYLAPTLDSIVEERSGYAPTPFSSADNWYTGGLRFAANGNDPEVLYMRASRERGGEPHLRLHVEYSLLDADPLVLPAEDLVEAALRVLALQRGMRLEQGLVERLVAEAGLLILPWIDRPDNADARPPPGAAPADPDAAAVIASLGEWAAGLPQGERDVLYASISALLGMVVHADGKFDRLERIEVDWIMNFAVPAQLGDSFRFSPAAEAAYQGLGDMASGLDEARLGELGRIVAGLPAAIGRHYRRFVASVCRSAAESPGALPRFGTTVSPAASAALDRIGAALGLADADWQGPGGARNKQADEGASDRDVAGLGGGATR